MKFLASFVLIFPLLLDSAFADLASGAAVADSWVVTLKNTVGASSSSVDSHYDWLNDILGASTGSVADGKKPGITYKYSIPNFNGYAGVFSKDVLEQIKKRSDVPPPSDNLPKIILIPASRSNPSTKTKWSPHTLLAPHPPTSTAINPVLPSP